MSEKRRPFPWPDGAAAAVTMTYDDALASQLDIAVPALNRHGLRGTFFLSDRDRGIRSRESDWARAAEEGHELAGHTLSHPCGRGRSWLKAGEALEDFDEARLLGEFRDSSAWLERLGAPRPHTYAYTCGETTLGEPRRSYVPLVRAHYSAARGIANRLNDPWTEDLYGCAALHGHNLNAAGLVAMVEKAIEQGGWAVFMFHGIGGGTTPVRIDEHEALLRHVAQRSSRLLVAPFSRVAGVVMKIRDSLSGMQAT